MENLILIKSLKTKRINCAGNLLRDDTEKAIKIDFLVWFSSVLMRICTYLHITFLNITSIWYTVQQYYFYFACYSLFRFREAVVVEVGVNRAVIYHIYIYIYGQRKSIIINQRCNWLLGEDVFYINDVYIYTSVLILTFSFRTLYDYIVSMGEGVFFEWKGISNIDNICVGLCTKYGIVWLHKAYIVKHTHTHTHIRCRYNNFITRGAKEKWLGLLRRVISYLIYIWRCQTHFPF